MKKKFECEVKVKGDEDGNLSFKVTGDKECAELLKKMKEAD